MTFTCVFRLVYNKPTSQTCTPAWHIPKHLPLTLLPYSLIVYMTILHKEASVHCHKFLRAVQFGRYWSTSHKEKTKI